MAQLTVEQTERYRRLIGDTGNEYDLQNSDIQAEYDSAVSDAPTSSLVQPYAIVYMLRLRLGMTVNLHNVSTLDGGESRDQKHAQIKALLEYWEGKAGLAGGSIVAGSIDLGLDETSTSSS